MADIYRADVHRANPGHDGYCGFTIPIHDFSWREGFRILTAHEGPALRGSPFEIDSTKPSRVPHRIEGELLFLLDPVGSQIAGWLSSSVDPASRRKVVLEVDRRLVASQTACLFRRNNSGLDGFHGFSLAMPRLGSRIRLIDADLDVLLHQQRR